MSTSWRRLAQIARDRRFGGGRRRRRIERRNREQLVDRRRLGLLLDEAVALRERRDLVGADALDERDRNACGCAPRFARRRATSAARRWRDRTTSRACSRCPRPSSRSPAAKWRCDSAMRSAIGSWSRDRLGRAHLHDGGRGRSDRHLDRLRPAAAPDDR